MAAKLPEHIAMIMDGNGRWAQSRGQARVEGHRAGAKTVRDITTYCRELGVGYVTLYAFSSENWGRPEDEVEALMVLLSEYLIEERTTLLDNEIRLGSIGNTDKLPSGVVKLLTGVEEATAHLDGMRLTLALSYGSRDEIVRGLRALASSGADLTSLTEDQISDSLDTGDVPDPDLIIRTSGERRLSNFLMWQAAYSELYFTDVAWPDFTREELDVALAEYARRKRRFGLTGEQVETE
jgi:undecaprenyl diphosphate synthase